MTFEAKVAKGSEGKTIQNIIVVKGDNVDEPDKPENSTTVVPPHVPEVPANPEQPSHSEPDTPGHHLPNTATEMYNLLLAGFALVLIGASLIVWKEEKETDNRPCFKNHLSSIDYSRYLSCDCRIYENR